VHVIVKLAADLDVDLLIFERKATRPCISESSAARPIA